MKMLQQNTHVEVFAESSSLVEQRREERSQMVYRLVHVEAAGDEGLARCRNISNHGMKLELTMPVKVGAALKIAFSASFRCLGRVIWARGSECGIAFDYPIDAAAVLRDSAAEAAAQQRGLCLQGEVKAKVCFDGRTHEAVSSEVTQYGMRIRHSGAFRSGLCVTVMLGGGRERRGVVRTSKGDMADVLLIDHFSVSDLGSAGALQVA
jgi:hypothetical protein